MEEILRVIFALDAVTTISHKTSTERKVPARSHGFRNDLTGHSPDPM